MGKVEKIPVIMQMEALEYGDGCQRHHDPPS